MTQDQIDATCEWVYGLIQSGYQWDAIHKAMEENGFPEEVIENSETHYKRWLSKHNAEEIARQRSGETEMPREDLAKSESQPLTATNSESVELIRYILQEVANLEATCLVTWKYHSWVYLKPGVQVIEKSGPGDSWLVSAVEINNNGAISILPECRIRGRDNERNAVKIEACEIESKITINYKRIANRLAAMMLVYNRSVKARDIATATGRSKQAVSKQKEEMKLKLKS